MIGRKLAERLARNGTLDGQPIDKLTLLDVVRPETPAGFKDRVKTVAADLSARGEAAKAVADRPQADFHLAGVVSGEAELDFDKGYHVHLYGNHAALEAIRTIRVAYPPRLA